MAKAVNKKGKELKEYPKLIRTETGKVRVCSAEDEAKYTVVAAPTKKPAKNQGQAQKTGWDN